MKRNFVFSLACSAFIANEFLAGVVRGADGGFSNAYGPHYQAVAVQTATASPQRPLAGLSAVRRWNQIAMDATGLDHTPVQPGETRVFGEQLGPCRASRAMAIVHIAMFDTIVAVMGQFESYTGVRAPTGPVALPVAVSQAAHDALVSLFPSQRATFDTRLSEDLADMKNPMAKRNGVNLGSRAAAAILSLRSVDGSEHPEPRVGQDYFTGDLPGHWRQDPISMIPLALGGH